MGAKYDNVSCLFNLSDVFWQLLHQKTRQGCKAKVVSRRERPQLGNFHNHLSITTQEHINFLPALKLYSSNLGQVTFLEKREHLPTSPLCSAWQLPTNSRPGLPFRNCYNVCWTAPRRWTSPSVRLGFRKRKTSLLLLCMSGAAVSPTPTSARLKHRHCGLQRHGGAL